MLIPCFPGLSYAQKAFYSDKKKEQQQLQQQTSNGNGALNFRRPVPGMSAVVPSPTGNQAAWNSGSGGSDDDYSVPVQQLIRQKQQRQQQQRVDEDMLSPGVLHHQVQVHHNGNNGHRGDALSFSMASLTLNSRRTVSQSPAPNHQSSSNYGSSLTSQMAPRIRCPSPLGDPCSSCYSSDERSMGTGAGNGAANGGNKHGPVCASTPTPHHHPFWQTAKNMSPGGGSGGRTSPSDLGYHTLVTRGGSSSSSAGMVADVLPLGLNLTHGLSAPLASQNGPGISPWSTETHSRPPPVVPRGSSSANSASSGATNFHQAITLTMSMMDPPPVGAHRPAPPTPPGLEISALVSNDVSGSSLDHHHHHHHHLLHSSSSSAASMMTPRRPVAFPTSGKMTAKRTPGKHLSPFDRLADDVILKIFSYLSTQELCSCARVSRRFYHLAWDPKLWTSISLNDETVNPDRAIKAVLRLLSREGNGTSPAGEVEKVVLNGCARITDRSIAAISRKCPRLRHLEVRNCPGLSDQALVHLAHRCLDLEHLDFTGCTQITCLSLQYLDGLMGNGTKVRTSLPSPGSSSQSESQLDSSSSSASPLFSIPPQLPPKRMCLQYLDLTDCHMLEDQGLTTVVSVCTQLLYLYLRRCIRITDVGVKAVASYCVLLREFSVSDCVQVTDLSMYKLAALGPNLRYLSVAKCEQVTDAGLTQVARRCYKLRYLNVRGCEAVTDSGVEILARSCPRLRALDVGKCDVTDRGLRFLSQYCPNLKKLSLKSCDVITNKGIQYIAYYCRGLQQLNIQDTCITVEGYRAVKKFCKRCIIEHTNPAFY